MKILHTLIILCLFCLRVYAVPAMGALSDLQGYKSLRFGMSVELADSIITTNNVKAKNDLYGEFLEELSIRSNSMVRKYVNHYQKLAYYLFFFDSGLYRIDIATFSGASYSKLEFDYPVVASEIFNLIEMLSAQYGKVKKIDIEYYSYYGKPFEEKIYWWTSSLASVSLVIQPYLDTLDKHVKLYSYRISFFDDIAMKKVLGSSDSDKK